MSSTHRNLYLYESVFFISIWVSELPVSFHLQLMPFTMISEKKESGFLFPFPKRRSVREVTVEIHADVEDGRSRARVSLHVFPRTRAPEFDEGTNERETSSLSWKHPADLVQFPLRRRLDAQ